MPVSPQQLRTIDQTAVDRAVEQIDDKLLAQKLPGGSGTVEVITSSVGLEAAERAQIVHLYKLAGWVEVRTKTSAENGERPGLLSVRLSTIKRTGGGILA